MRRIAPIALAAALACTSEISSVDPGPRDTFYLPTAVGVHDGKVLVASSNSDLRYDPETGGTVIAVDALLDPTSGRPPLTGTVNIESFSGELAMADAAAGCTAIAPIAVVPVRGANRLFRVSVGAGGSLACGIGCSISLTTGQFADPYAVGVACGPDGRGGTIARAYVGYLRSTLGVAWVTQVDLTMDPSADGAVQHAPYDTGQVRSFAYDPVRQRLYLVRTLTGTRPTLRWIDLAPDRNGVYCRLDRLVNEGGCRSGTSSTAALAEGLELRAIALSTSNVPFRRAYMTARVFDPTAIPRIDYEGLLIVADVAEDALGQLDLRVVREIPIGLGVSEVRVLPARAGKRDVVAAIGGDRLWIYDDETGDITTTGTTIVNGRDTGHPVVGTTPFSLAVDPDANGGTAHVYVGAYDDNAVKQLDVPLANPTAVPPAVVRTLIGGTP